MSFAVWCVRDSSRRRPLRRGLWTHSHYSPASVRARPFPTGNRTITDPSSIPTACAGGDNFISGGLPSVTVLGPSFGAPRLWRSSLGVTRRFASVYSVSVDALYARGVAQRGAADLNLNTAPQFSLGSEGGRPVFVPAGSIDSATGAVSLNASRLHPAFGPVTEINSSLKSITRQLVMSLERPFANGANVTASYTYTRSRDQSQGFPGAEYDETTAGNPNFAEWGTNDDERRHQLLTTLLVPVGSSVEFSMIGRVVSGRPFTPLANGDINGDGERNDRAFIFDPTTTADPALASGMRELLSVADPRTRDCLRQQLATIAGRNSCTTAWRPELDLRMNLTPSFLGLQRRLTISVSAQNSITGLDQLLHGSAHLRGWGQGSHNDDRLLFVDGFDPATSAFRYSVNQHFGASDGRRSPFRSPFRLQIQGRYVIGQSRSRNRS